MPEFDRVRQVFEGSDRLSSTVQRIGKSFESLARSISGTTREGQELSVNFRELDRMLDEVGEQATPTTTNRFRFLKEAIEDTVTTDGIVSIRALDQELERLGEQAGFTDATIEQLQDTGRQLANQFFGTSISAQNLSENIEELGDEGELSAVQVSVLNRAIDETADAGDITSVEQLKDNFEELALSAGFSATEVSQASRALDDLLLSALQASGGISEVTATSLGLRQAMERSEEGVEDLRQELRGAVLDMTAFDLKALGTLAVFEALDAAADDAEKEFSELRRAFNELLPDNPVTTLNLGPVNISLNELVSTVVSLVTFIGPLITTVAGLATAFGTLAIAVGSIMAVGFLQFLEHVEARFAGITNRAEALEAIVSGLARSAREALAPLMQARIGGESPFGFFISMVRGGLRWLNDFANVMAEIAEMDAVARSLSRMSTALFTADEGPRMMEAMTAAVERMLPIMTDVIVFMINNFPDLIMFMTQITEETAPALGDIFNILIPTFAQLIRVGSELIGVISLLTQGAAAAISPFLTLFDIANDLLFFVELGEVMEDLIAFIFGVSATFLILNTVVGVLTTTYEIFTSVLLIARGVLLLFSGTTLLATNGLWGLVSAQTAVTLGAGRAAAALAFMNTALGSIIARVLIATGGLWGLVAAETVATISSGGLTAAIYSLVASLTALELAIAATGIGALLILLGLAIYAFLNWEDTVDAVSDAFDTLNSKLEDFLIRLGLSETWASRLADTMTGLLKLLGLFVMGPSGWAIAAQMLQRRANSTIAEAAANRSAGAAAGSSPGPGPAAGNRTNVEVNVEGNVDDPDRFGRRVAKEVEKERRRKEVSGAGAGPGPS